MSIQSIVSPLQPGSSTCGYCGPPGERSAEETNRHAAELMPVHLSCEDYQKMIDRGWRRSGTYCYMPDLKTSCCPQYTIRLDALQFKASKSQRKLVNRFNRFVFHDDSHGKDSAKNTPEFKLEETLHAPETSFRGDKEAKHTFEVTLEPSSFTEEKFEVYKEYQREIHHEQVEKRPVGFKRFLVESPLHREPIPYPTPPPAHLPREYGSYHQMYRLDGELIAVGIIDILPNCVSSVYFMYKKKWEKLSLGKLSALREMSLAREIHDAGVTDMRYLYMGYYIQSCPKMRYKAEYSPSYLADPEEYTWHPLEECRPLLEKYRYACFAHPEHSIEGSYDLPTHASQLSRNALQHIRVLTSVEDENLVVTPANLTTDWNRLTAKRAITATVNGLGLELAKEMVFYLLHV